MGGVCPIWTVLVDYLGKVKDTFVTSHCVERLSSFRGDFLYSVYTRVLLACPLLGGLSSFGVSFIGGFTVQRRGRCPHVRSKWS